MIKRKYVEDMNISDIPTYLPSSTTITYLNTPLFSIETTMDCGFKIKHVNSEWEYKYKPFVAQYLVDDDGEFVNPWSIKQDFNKGMVRYLIKCNKINKCEVYIDPIKHMATVVYIENGELRPKSFGLPVKENN